MAEPIWKPLGVESEEYDALVEGIPSWLATSFSAWLRTQVTTKSNAAAFLLMDLDLIREIERVCRIHIGTVSPDPSRGFQAFHGRLLATGSELKVADFLLSRRRRSGAESALNALLTEGGSAWTTGLREGRPGLTRRVSPAVQEAATQAMTASSAGRALSDAWNKAFGISPDPSVAYVDAVRAVEHAAVPIVVPKQSNATLGHVIGQLRKDGDWGLPLTRETRNAPTWQVVLSMCEALWHGHHDRHGGGSHSVPVITQQEAETAVLLAVPLVHWFTSGAIARTEGPL